MSAIFGILHFDGNRVSEEQLARMNSALSSHGCDGDAVWSDNNIGLGRRLSCLTPEYDSERQQLICREGQTVVVSDARIDNRRELIESLGILPSGAAACPDSELILRSYLKWGAECPKRLIGAFTFAIWDGYARQLLVARSPMGERSLHYHFSRNSLTFASMPKGLFSQPSIERTLNLELLADYLAEVPIDSAVTLYKNIHRLPAGHLLLAGDFGFKVEQYWQPDDKFELRLKSDSDYLDAFTELFERVVADHLRSSSGIGIMLSGGLDSSTVAAVAAEQLQRNSGRLQAFTEVPARDFSGRALPGRYSDETTQVELMAARYRNIDLHLVRTDGAFYLDNLRLLFEATELPFRNASNLVWMKSLLYEAGSQGVRTVLSGAAGNVTISWHGSYLLSQLIGESQWLFALKEASLLSKHGNARSTLRAIVGQGLMPLLPDSLWCFARVLYEGQKISALATPWESYSPLNADFAKAHNVVGRARERNFDFFSRPCKDSRMARINAIKRGDGSCDILTGLQALSGVEVRDPTGDQRIFEFCLSLPEGQFQKMGVRRSLVRTAMKDRLPPEILNATTRGLQAADWFDRLQQAHGRVIDELDLMEKSPLAKEVLDIKRLRQLAVKLPAITDLTPKIFTDYRGVMERGLMTGRFIRWFETGA